LKLHKNSINRLSQPEHTWRSETIHILL